MFKSYDHFKKATQDLFKEVQNSKIKKLSELRTSIAQKAGFSSVQALENSFSVPQVNSVGLIEVVSVIYVNGDGLVIQKLDFLDTPANNKLAEERFVSILNEDSGKSFNDDELEAILEDGYYEIDDHMLQIVHSCF